jgi:hypothetical protein
MESSPLFTNETAREGSRGRTRPILLLPHETFVRAPRKNYIGAGTP